MSIVNALDIAYILEYDFDMENREENQCYFEMNSKTKDVEYHLSSGEHIRLAILVLSV